MSLVNKNKYLQLKEQDFSKKYGKVSKIVGLTIESIGPDAKLNDVCRILSNDPESPDVMAEVVGFKDKKLLLMPFETVEGIGPDCMVENTGDILRVKVGEALLGKIVDGLGRCIDNTEIEDGEAYSVEAPPPDPMERVIISDILSLGVKAVDGLITVGKGQRIGIFAGSGVGKSTLMGMFARNTRADINVIGERGREVR